MQLNIFTSIKKGVPKILMTYTFSFQYVLVKYNLHFSDNLDISRYYSMCLRLAFDLDENIFSIKEGFLILKKFHFLLTS